LHFLNSALSKIPSIVPDNSSGLVVYRGIPMSDMFTTNYTQNQRIIWSAFTSTSRNPSIAFSFTGSKGIVLCIEVFHGKNISDYSYVKSEDEILLVPNTEFLVKKPLTKEFLAGCNLECNVVWLTQITGILVY